FYTYPNGARVHMCGMDRPGAALSSERDFIFVNQAEQLDVDDWEILSTRTTGRGAVTATPMLFGDCNPGHPSHWILQRPSLRLLHSKHTDNPTLYDDAGAITPQGERTMAILDSLTGVRFGRLREGKWVAAEGTVYEEFDRSVHVIRRDLMPTPSRYVVSIDFGFTNAFVCQLWAIDNDGRMYLEREIYRTQRIVEDHAKDIRAMIGGRKVEAFVADHDAEDRATLQRHGISTLPAIKAVTVGIQAVQARMGKADAGIKPRLFVVSGALIERDEALAAAKKPVCTEDEFEVYAWPKSSNGKAVKEEPVKENDHGMDAMRYAVMYVDQGRTDGHVSVVYPRATSSYPTAARTRLF
ncbi:MAG TPA: hypothetical protein VHP57_09975, partial [Acidimicrobiia bacterium]|nr:hypothetical protein [Acidimicrobiia bacterium]